MMAFRDFQATGLQVVPSVLTASQVETVCRAIEPLLVASNGQRRPGVRGVLQKVPQLIDVIISSQCAQVIREVLGPDARIIRAIVFDKTPESNWMVPWHQDSTIAVRERIDTPGFGPWAVKDGEHHCRPPCEIMERIITLRVHLDDCGIDQGPLRVLSGTHRLGILPEHEIAALAEQSTVLEPEVARGEAILTTPLAVHSSRRSTRMDLRRRVLHLDCAAVLLPHGLQWAEEVVVKRFDTIRRD